MSYLTIDKIKEKYNKLYFTWPGLGDNLCLFTAVRNYYEQTGKKLLISTNRAELLEYTDYCDYIDDISQDFEKNKETIEKLGIKIIFISCTNIKWLNKSQNVLQWPQQHITAEYCSRLGLNGQVNLNPAICLSEDEKKFGRFYDKKQIAIMTDGLQNYKTYPFEKIQRVVNKLYRKYHFVQIGSKTDRCLRHCLDKRGKLTLRQVASVLYNSDCFVGSIGGLSHLAASVKCPSIINYSLGEPYFLCSYPNNINLISKVGCNLCGRNLRDPQHQICYNDYSCIRSINEKDVIAGINQMMSKIEQYQQKPFIVAVSANKEKGLTHYYAQFKTLWCQSAFNNIYRGFKIYILGIPILQYYENETEWNVLLGKFSILKCQITK